MNRPGRRIVLTALVLLAGQATEALAQSASPRNAFPGRRIGGGTRAACTGRLLAHLVPASSVYAPDPSMVVGLLEGPVGEPRPLEVSFRPLRDAGKGTSTVVADRRSLPPSPVGVRLITLRPVSEATVWQSSYRCEVGAEKGGDPLSFMAPTVPPVVTLLVTDGTTTDRDVQARLRDLRLHCGSSVSRSQVARDFDLRDFMVTGWPERLPVRCL